MKKLIFIDLDGTIIDTETGKTFPSWIGDMKFNLSLLDKLVKIEPEVIAIVSNQGGIEQGFVDNEHFCSKLNYIANAIESFFKSKGKIVITIGMYCPTNNKEYSMRKPNTGMLQCVVDGLTQMNKSYEKSDMLMIGDASGLPGQFSDSDKKTAENFEIDYIDVNEFTEQ